MPYSTGLFAVFDDLPILLYGSSCGTCLAIHNSVIAADNQAAFGLPGDMVTEKGEMIGCTNNDGAICLNGCLFMCCNAVYCLWRKQVREKTGVDGSLPGDIIATCCCGVAAIMQDARELKGKGMGYSESMK